MENKKIDNHIIITDSEGKEHIMEILFTYDHPVRKTSYVFFYDPEHPEEVIAMRYNEEGELIEIEDDEEYEEVEEVFNAFNEDPAIKES
ncbi:MAG TPA: DUF1292 domain-containing protein [Bacilli bacterium]|nr:DUF1292 domain-containing protein [Bacilli bacterium]HPS18743.1 DUF1292 domain-containing protein [Bacilli bacterium]